MVKCQVVSPAKGNVANVFPFAEKFFSFELSFSVGEGKREKAK